MSTIEFNLKTMAQDAAHYMTAMLRIAELVEQQDLTQVRIGTKTQSDFKTLTIARCPDTGALYAPEVVIDIDGLEYTIFRNHNSAECPHLMYIVGADVDVYILTDDGELTEDFHIFIREA